MSDAAELLPCPFCGGDYQTWHGVRDGRSLGCSKCGARFVKFYGKDVIEDRLAAAWNTRADLADVRIAQARAEALREAADRLNLAAEQWGSRGNEPTAAAVLRVEAKAILALIEKEHSHE